MWLHRFTKYLVHNRLSALIFTFALAFIPIIGVISIAIVALITLIKGIKEGAFFSIAAILPILIIFWLRYHQVVVPIIFVTGVVFSIVSILCTWIFAGMLRKQQDFSNIFQLSALAGVLIVSIIHLLYPDIANWWANQLRYVNEHMGIAMSNVNKNNHALTAKQLEVINITKNYATGMIVAIILLKSWVMLMLGRLWQGFAMGTSLLRQELTHARLNPLTGFLFIASLVLWYLGNNVILDFMPILYLLFGMVGLCIFHYLFALNRTTMTLFWISLFYIIFIITFPSSIIIVGLIALLDIWLNIRQRIKKN